MLVYILVILLGFFFYYNFNKLRHDCADTLTFTVTNGSYWIYEHLINRGYKIFIYSGNTDLVKKKKINLTLFLI